MPLEAKSYRLGPLTLFPRGPYWHCRYQIDGARKQYTTKEPLHKRDAAETRALQFFEADRLRARGVEPCPTLGAAFALWEQTHILRKSPKHVANVASIGRLHLGALKDTLLKDLTTAAVEMELSRFLEDHAPSFGNIWLSYIRLVCKWAVRRGMIRRVPFDVPFARIKQRNKGIIPTAKARQWLEEVDFLAANEPSIAMILRLQIGLGLRGGEARLARWEWLDLERGLYTPGDTKGGKAWPRPVPPWILDRLRPLAKASGWMTAGRRGRPVSTARIKRVFDKACQAVGLPKLTPHRLRATYATWLSEEGVPIQDIQKALEHKDIRTTAAYLGSDLGRIAAAQERLGRRTGLGR